MGTIPTVKRVCLITTSHIASNPRLVKEATTLTDNNYIVHIIFAQYVDFLVNRDKQILLQHPAWTYSVINFTGNTLFSTLRRLTLLSTVKLIKRSGLKFKYAHLILNSNFSWQLRKAKAFSADLYIAHNLGALPVAVTAARYHHAKSGFDAEDFHRHEVSDDVNNDDVKLKIAVEEKYIPQTDYITASSPQIAEKYISLFNKPITTILNVFPKSQGGHLTQHNTLNIFWFSQTIGPNRGLEEAIEAAAISGLKLTLHLLGNVSDSYKDQLYQIAKTTEAINLEIKYHKWVSSDELFNVAAQYDIGLSSEPGFCINNNIALSNKLFTYIQSGLAVLVSATPAQQEFMQQYPQTGKLYNNVHELAQALIDYNNNKDLLYQTKANSFQIGQNILNWETEGQKFLRVIGNTLN